MEIRAYLSFNGDCEAALTFYEQALGAKTTFLMRHKDAPEQQGAADWAEKILHARFEVEGNVLMASDSPPNWYNKPAGLCISINLNDSVKAKNIFAALTEGGEIQMPLQKTFWASAFGMARDKFGIPWMVNCE